MKYFLAGVCTLLQAVASSSGYEVYPKNFLWGVAISEYQNSGADNIPNCNWSDWEKKGNPYIKGGQKSGKSLDHFNNYAEHIDLLKQLGANTFRFSIEWSLVEPRPGEFDQSVIDWYRQELRDLKNAGITPMVTLHHFTSPNWFERLGGFVDEGNIDLFVRFCRKVFGELHAEAPLWCVINEPAIYGMMGYVLGEFPPGDTDLNRAGLVIKNMLAAHCTAYKAMKKIDPKPRIGFVHSYIKFESYRSWNVITKTLSSYLSSLFHENILSFFETGIYKFYLPLIANQVLLEEEAPKLYDFVGINYYCKPVLATKFSLSEPVHARSRTTEVVTDKLYAISPEGLYEAIMDCRRFKKPIYITENGIADHLDDRRESFIKQHVDAMTQAIRDGADVRGYYYWTLADNFEWAEGWNMEFGLFKPSRDRKSFTLKKGGKAFAEVIANYKAATARVGN